MAREPEARLLIEDYAVVGDTSTMALIGKDGSVDWLCLPRFDSSACFAKLLGDESNGRWQVVPRHWSKGAVRNLSRRYRPGTMILETTYETETGRVRVTDAMPPRDRHADLIRRIEGLDGEVEMAMRWVVRFAYGDAVPWMRRIQDEDGNEAVSAVAGPDAVLLRGHVLPEPDRSEGHRAHHTHFTVKAGDTVDLTMSWYASHEPMPHCHDVGDGLDKTERFWREWSDRSTYDGPYREAVDRSLLTLKAMTYEPTGGIVAAPTTSLPEQIGGPRNWDYRFCWLRDATRVLSALLDAGYTEEAAAWRSWLLRAIAGSPEQMQIMYGLHGERQLPELELSWLPGYEGSGPVRIGNAASEQFQLDVYGEVAAALYSATQAGLAPDDMAWDVTRASLAHLESVMDKPDSGLWEVRGEERHFTFSKVMVWVAFDRAVRAVEEYGARGDVERWRELRDKVHAQVCEQGWNEELGSFTQYFGGTELDASVLVMASVGFLPGADPRFVSTVAAVEKALRTGPFVKRYETAAHIDGLPPGEGCFLACSFWLVSALAQVGRVDEAQEVFEQLLELRNDVGLLAEEYDPEAGRMLGNFPQAFSHLTLVEAATTLAEHGVRGSGSAARGTDRTTDS
ncbi:MAG: glycoside hydrolase family 15 protein [Actinobacteria bacterium]|nr:glycoside hydrolase family 15 protein [Actinomycetota bacterium]